MTEIKRSEETRTPGNPESALERDSKDEWDEPFSGTKSLFIPGRLAGMFRKDRADEDPITRNLAIGLAYLVPVGAYGSLAMIGAGLYTMFN